MKTSMRKLGWSGALLGIGLATIALHISAVAQDRDPDDPPSRVARLGYMEGSVSFQPAGETDWVGAVPNRPMTTGDQLWTDQNSRAELQLGSSVIRLAPNTGFSFLDLDDQTVQIQLTSGAISITVRRLGEDDDFEVDTPNQAFTIFQPGHYRVEASADGDYTVISVREGEGEATGNGQSFDLRGGQRATLSGTESLYAEVTDIGDPDDFDNWAHNRDHRYDYSRSARYLSHDVVGYEDLDDYGDWRDDGNYGHVWFPNQVAVGWAPYHTGHWAWISPWGYTWVDDSSWGYAPFHYGRWVSVEGRWGWVAGPVAVQAVYAPALVVFIGGGPGAGGFGGNVGWFPLGPREVYVPSYHVSEAYVTRVNVSSTTVSVTQVTNVYHTTIINNTTTNVTNITYANRNVQGAVVVVPQHAFASAQPVARTAVPVSAREIAAAGECAGCSGAREGSRSRRQGVDRGPCGGASGSDCKPAGGGQENASAPARAICETAAGSGSASRTAAGEERGEDAAAGGFCGGISCGEGCASRQTVYASCWQAGGAAHRGAEGATRTGDEPSCSSSGCEPAPGGGSARGQPASGAGPGGSTESCSRRASEAGGTCTIEQSSGSESSSGSGAESSSAESTGDEPT